MTLTNEDLLAISNLLDVKLKPIDKRLTSLETKVDNLEFKVSVLDNQAARLELPIENVTDKNIALLAENYVPAARQFEKASYEIEALQADNDIIKKVLGEHSGKLEKIS